MIAGTAKAYGLTPEYVLYEMSYANVVMYGAVLPSYRKGSKGKQDNQKVIRADDPRNNNKVRQFLDNIE